MDIALGGADDSLDIHAAHAVDEIRFRQHVGHGNQHGAQLVQRHGGEPVFIVPLQADHHMVAPADPRRTHHIGDAAAGAGYVTEGEDMLLTQGVAPDHGPLAGGPGGDGVHHIIAEIEVVGIVEPDLGQSARPVKLLGAVIFINAHWSFSSFVPGMPIRRNRS